MSATLLEKKNFQDVRPREFLKSFFPGKSLFRFLVSGFIGAHSLDYRFSLFGVFLKVASQFNPDLIRFAITAKNGIDHFTRFGQRTLDNRVPDGGHLG